MAPKSFYIFLIWIMFPYYLYFGFTWAMFLLKISVNYYASNFLQHFSAIWFVLEVISHFIFFIQENTVANHLENKSNCIKEQIKLQNHITGVISGKNFEQKRGSSKTKIQIIRKHGSYKKDVRNIMAPWFSGYQYCTTFHSFNKAWTQILGRFKLYSRRVRDLRWWESLTIVLAG